VPRRSLAVGGSDPIQLRSFAMHDEGDIPKNGATYEMSRIDPSCLYDPEDPRCCVDEDLDQVVLTFYGRVRLQPGDGMTSYNPMSRSKRAAPTCRSTPARRVR